MADGNGKHGDIGQVEWHYHALQKVYETALYHDEQIDKKIAALEAATRTLENQSKALPGAVSAEVAKLVASSFKDATSKLSDGVDVLLEGLKAEAEAAGSRIAERFESANVNASKAAAAYERAAELTFRRVAVFALLGTACGVAAMVATAWYQLPNEKQLQAMRAEEARLERNIADLVRRGGEVEVITCTMQGGGVRPCVRTDERGNPNPFRRDPQETFRLIERR